MSFNEELLKEICKASIKQERAYRYSKDVDCYFIVRSKTDFLALLNLVTGVSERRASDWFYGVVPHSSNIRKLEEFFGVKFTKGGEK